MTTAGDASRTTQPPRLIAWELTRSCMLACKHCRAAAHNEPYPGELDTRECLRLVDNIASFAKPILILTGGEPMLREDIYEIASHASRKGLRVVMAPCGLLLDDEAVRRIRAAGISAISISLDGATADSHDAFRGVEGAFAGAMGGIGAARRGDLPFQINTTVTAGNRHELPAMLDLSISLGATCFNPFLLVPTGRGAQLVDQELTAEQYEQTLNWLADQQEREDILIRVTCAPHYQRILRQRGISSGPRGGKGCMGGKSFAFISHRGIVQICGFLDTPCGDLHQEGLDFRQLWEHSPLLQQIRDVDSYGGRCGGCEFRYVCGGCRARAEAIEGSHLGQEPFCTYQPRSTTPSQNS
ncbi:MAG: radical SAM protein [Planctomycetota bacterium]